MRNVLSKSSSEFNSFPFSLQVGCIAFTWIFCFFTIDAWFSPFYFHGYQLISYTFVVLVLSSWLAHQAIFRLVKSSILWDYSTVKKSAIVQSCQELTIKDICYCELNSFAKSVAETAINYWCDDSSNNEEFVKEIHNQLEDIFFSLSGKLSKIKVQYFVKNLILILHNHLKSYMKTASNKTNLPSHSKSTFNHPVSRGEISLELYLDSLSHAVMKEFIPGSIQDCSAVFDLSCAAFSSQVLVKFVDCLSQPGLVLQTIIQVLESIEKASDFTDTNSSLSYENAPPKLPNISGSSKSIDDPLSGSSPRLQEAEELESTDSQASNFSARSGSPVLAGSLSCNSLVPSTQPLAESSWDNPSSVKTGLCSSLSTATAPLLPLQCTTDFGFQSQIVKPSSKPSSLPLLSTDSSKTGSVDSDPNVPFSIDTDVSPVYEDVEDFATAIAKLRSLLEQRVSSNGVDVPCGKNSNVFSPTCDVRACSSGAETESSFEELTEASELPNDSRIFFNVKIPRTETCMLPNEGQHSFYCIVYDGIYTAVSATQCNNPEESQKDSRLVLKSRTVRRRFRQFMELHTQLESSEDPAISQAIRSIRGPSKWLNLPFSRLDQNTVAHRQVYLERYMQHLCTSSIIGVSRELRNFLDYELHLNEISVTPSSVALNRVPFFAKTVSGVLQSIKTALPLPIPGFDNDPSPPVQLVPLPLPSFLPTSFDPPEREEKSSQSATSSIDEMDGRSTPVPCRITYASEESRLEQLLNNWNHIDCRVESAYEAFESHLWRSELNIQVSQETTAIDSKPPKYLDKIITENTLEYSKDGWDRFDRQLPLTSSVINLLIDSFSLQETWLTKAPVSLALKIVVGKRVEEFFQESLLQLTNPNLVAENFRSLREKIDSDSLNAIVIDEEKNADELVMEIVKLLSKQIPGLLVKIIGEDLCADVLKTAFSCLTDPQLNRDLSLTLLDFVISQICDTQTTVDRSSP